ncbi:MAG: hypothetical protein MJ224_00230 [archaeon]|nr:hypothetical protein [archaeon]
MIMKKINEEQIKKLLKLILIDFECMEYDLPCGKVEENAPYYGIDKQKERAEEILKLIK